MTTIQKFIEDIVDGSGVAILDSEEQSEWIIIWAMKKEVFIMMMNKMKISVKQEKTDFGDVWYISSSPKGIFRFAIYRYDDDKKNYLPVKCFCR